MRSTIPRKYLWGYKDEHFHRLARSRPWWEQLALFVVMGGVVVGSGGFLHFCRRLAHVLRSDGDDLNSIEAIDKKLLSRPDLASAAVKMTLHHLICECDHPFGSPMVAPHYLQAEARELAEMIHAERPHLRNLTLPDIWALVTTRSLIAIGGPCLSQTRGRQGTDAEGVELCDWKVNVNERNVSVIRGIISRKSLSTKEGVAAFGVYRYLSLNNIGTPIFTKSTNILSSVYFKTLCAAEWKRPWYSRGLFKSITINATELECNVMQGIDVSLLDDALLRGWAERFSHNEHLLFDSLGTVLDRIMTTDYGTLERCG